jgi:hypothetical protein
MVELTASNGRMVFSPALAIKSRPFQRALSGVRTQNHGSFSGAIATTVLPNCALAILTALIQRSGLSSRAGIKASAPFQRAVAASIGKWAN